MKFPPPFWVSFQMISKNVLIELPLHPLLKNQNKIKSNWLIAALLVSYHWQTGRFKFKLTGRNGTTITAAAAEAAAHGKHTHP